jgi:acetyl-CoA acetyltransferase
VILGIGCTAWLPESDAVLDELVFDATSAALREAGVRKPDLGLSVTASLDVFDARSISCGLTNAAAGGYLAQSYRIEGDAGQAIIAAAQAIAAGDAEVAVAVGVYNPEVSTPDPVARRAFLGQLSNLAFEPHADRPVALTADTMFALHAARAIADGVLTEAQLAELAAAEITRGAPGPHALRRAPVSAAQVLASPRVNGALRELMLPAEATGAIAVVLGSLPRARRAAHVRAVLTGWGQATADTTAAGQWLFDPAAATRRAAAAAYARAGLVDPASEIDALEVTVATPALLGPVCEALGLEKLADRANPSGGVRSCYPGVANGALRLLEAVRGLEQGGRRAVAQSSDLLTGTVADTATVLVVEAI